MKTRCKPLFALFCAISILFLVPSSTLWAEEGESSEAKQLGVINVIGTRNLERSASDIASGDPESSPAGWQGNTSYGDGGGK